MQYFRRICSTFGLRQPFDVAVQMFHFCLRGKQYQYWFIDWILGIGIGIGIAIFLDGFAYIFFAAGLYCISAFYDIRLWVDYSSPRYRETIYTLLNGVVIVQILALGYAIQADNVWSAAFAGVVVALAWEHRRQNPSYEVPSPF